MRVQTFALYNSFSWLLKYPFELLKLSILANIFVKFESMYIFVSVFLVAFCLYAYMSVLHVSKFEDDFEWNQAILRYLNKTEK